MTTTAPDVLAEIDRMDAVFAELGMDEMCELCVSLRTRIAALVEAARHMQGHSYLSGQTVCVPHGQYLAFCDALKGFSP